MVYPGTGVIFSHYASSVPNIKWFSFDLSTAPTTSRTLTGAASGDYVIGVTGLKYFSAAGAQGKLSVATIATSIGTALIKFSNGMSNMAVFGTWIDRNA